MAKAAAKSKPGSNMPEAPKPLTPQEVRAWLDAEYAPLAARRDEMVKALMATLKAYPEIKSAEQLGVFIENIKTTREVKSAAERAFDEAKKPFLNGGRAVDAWKHSILRPIAEAIDKLQPIMDAWGRAELKRKQAEAAEDAERLRVQAEVDARAAMAAKTPHEAEAAYDNLAATAARQEIAEKAVIATPAQHTRTRGDFGAVGSMRTAWKWRMTDIALVPLEYLTVDEDKIKEALRERDPHTRKPIREIPGIEVYADQSMKVA